MNEAYLNKARAELCKRDFFEFVRYFWDTIIPETPVYNWHIPYLCKELQQIGERVKQRLPKEHDLLINIPPGTTKTTICVIMYPAWIWTIDPTQRILTTSYSASLAHKSSVKAKDIIKSKKYKALYPKVEIRSDIDNKEHYQNTKGGERMSFGLGGSILGSHAHQIIVDDPLNIKEAQSDQIRDKTNENFDSVTSTRKVDKKLTPVITIMQRLHEDDTAGHILNQDTNVKHINLPAMDNGKIMPKFLKTKYKDGLLDPIRLDNEILSEMKKKLGSYGFAGQMMQEPAPSEGGIIKKAWFNYCTMDEFITKANNQNIVWYYEVDGAYTSKKENAQSASLAWCMLDNQMYIRDCIGVWEELPDFIKTLVSFVNNNGYTPSSKIYVETKATGLPIIHTLKRDTGLNVVEDNIKNEGSNDKLSMAHASSPFVESRRVTLIKGGWNEDFVHQVSTFPNSKLKDKADCLFAAIRKAQSQRNSVMEWSVIN